jgi:hypothetical protein
MNGGIWASLMQLRTRTALLALGASVCVGAGCSRQEFRQRADRDVEGVLSQKNQFPAWKIENWHAYPDPRARFADNSCPDYPAYPPDDYAAYITSPNPQKPGRGGAGRFEGQLYLNSIEAWDAQNRAQEAADKAAEKAPASAIKQVQALQIPEILEVKKDSPKAEDPKEERVSTDLAGESNTNTGPSATFNSDQKTYRITAEQCVELALFNSREFQDRREDLYLAALPVTLERFNFAAQAFAASEVIRQSTGRQAQGGPGEAWRINTDPTISRNFATGGELIVRLANQIVVDLSGPSPQTSISNLTLTFAQPLLRGGGFAVTLEALTQAERTLLYAIRSYARFRKVFYAAIVGNSDYTNNPYGLQGLAANLGRGVGANLTARPTGYLPTVVRAATLANERKNVAALEQVLKRFQNLKDGGGVNELQVVRVEQQLLRSQQNVLNLTRTYLDNIDFFKLQLGVPATFPLELDQGPLKPIRKQLDRFEKVYDDLRAVELTAGDYNPKEPAAQYRKRWMQILTESALVRDTMFAKDYASKAEELAKLTNNQLESQLASLDKTRTRLLDEQAKLVEEKKPESPDLQAELEAVDSTIDRLRFEQALRNYEQQPWLRFQGERRNLEQATNFRGVFEQGMLVSVQAVNQRIKKLRGDWPKLPQLNVDDTDLLKVPLDEANAKIAQAALVNRLDLMNARAQVVDGWRQIAVRANALQGNFDVRYDLESTTPRDEANGLGFSGPRSRHTVTLRIDPPFVRRAERNQYRTALISYQRSRRNLMAFEDNIITDARQDLRTLRQLAEAYLLQQRVVELAYAQVDNAVSTFYAPPDPQARDSAAGVAALTQQLLEAQSSLVAAQNDLYTTWVNYLTARLELYLDLELLPLDARGLWIDDALTTEQQQSYRNNANPDGTANGDRGPVPGRPELQAEPRLPRDDIPRRLPDPAK